MGAPKGSQNAKGNKGGGRKSAFQENATAQFLADFFFKSWSAKTLLMKIKKGNFSVSERMLLSALNGDVRATTAVFNKLFPDKIDLDPKSDLAIEISKEVAKKYKVRPSKK